MRWYDHKNGDRKIVRRFALIPISINGEHRWLETCYIELVYACNWCEGWFFEHFVTKEDYENYRKNK